MTVHGAASIEVTQMIKRMREQRQRKIAAAIAAVDIMGEHTMGDSQQLCPKLSGFLAASGTTEPAELKDGTIEKRMGHNAFYAAAVHEILDPPVHHENGQAKYLETAIRRNAPKMMPFVADRVKAAS